MKKNRTLPIGYTDKITVFFNSVDIQLNINISEELKVLD